MLLLPTTLPLWKSPSFYGSPNHLHRRRTLRSPSTPYCLKKTRMSRRNNGTTPRVDLKLNLSLTRMQGNTSRMVVDDEEGSPNNSSSPKSCVSSAGNSPEATSMVLAGCPRCLMYVMLAEDDPKCPKCKSTVLINFNNDNNKGNTTKKNRKG